jgi:hypothetical protein
MDDFSGHYSEVLVGFSNWLTSPHANQLMNYRQMPQTTKYHSWRKTGTTVNIFWEGLYMKARDTSSSHDIHVGLLYITIMLSVETSS